MSEIIFEVHEDEVDGRYVASAVGYGIHTQGETLEELRTMVRDAVHCYFDETMPAPKVIRLCPSGAKAQISRHMMPGLKPRPTNESLK